MSTGQKSVTFYAVYTAQVLGAASKRLELVLEQFKTLEPFTAPRRRNVNG